MAGTSFEFLKRSFNTQQKGTNVRKAVIQRMNLIAEEIMRDSKDNYCPHKTGHLKATGQVIKAEPSMPTAIMYYYASYAVYVHEINKQYHKGKTWKYLEKPFRARQPRILDELAEAGREAMK